MSDEHSYSEEFQSAKKDDKPETKQREKVVLEINSLQNIEPCLFVETMVKVKHKDFHPALGRHLIPIKTTADGKCLWNMISITLVGDESLMPKLRRLTTNKIHQNMPYFTQLLSFFNPSTAVGFDPNTTVESILDDACQEGTWGGEHIMLAMSVALRRHIHIYAPQITSFDAEATDEEEIQKLANHDRRCRGHLLYKAENVNSKRLLCGT